jgi:hypothetical protein
MRRGIDWEAVWTTDARSLAAFRVGLGAAILVDLAQRAGDLRAHYTDEGMLPRASLGPVGRLTLPLHRLSGAAWAEGLLFVLAGVAAAMLLVGLCTRLATIASWLFLLSLHDRNPLVLEGGDGLVRIMLFFGMLLPLGAAFSIDARRRGAPVPSAVTGPAVLAFHVQIACLYALAAVFKLESSCWQDGTALGHALAGYHRSTAFGELVLAHPEIVRALSYGTIVVEVVAPVLLLWPARSPIPRAAGVIAHVALQLGIAACMNIGNFQPMACLWVVPMIPPAAWDRLGFASPGGDALDAPSVSSPVLGPAARLIPLLILVYVLGLNVESLVVPHQVTTRFDKLGYALGIDQRWDMYSLPSLNGRVTGWTVIPARLQGGREVDVLRGGAPLSWDKPSRPADLYGGFRWRSFTTGILWRLPRYRSAYAAYWCRAWNRAHQERVEALAVVWMAQVADARGALGPVERKVLWKGRCPAR